MKYVRDVKNNFSVKSVIPSIVLGGRVSDGALWSDTYHDKDVPNALTNIVGDVDAYLQANPSMPTVDDPNRRSENFNHPWDQHEYANFRNWAHT